MAGGVLQNGERSVVNHGPIVSDGGTNALGDILLPALESGSLKTWDLVRATGAVLALDKPHGAGKAEVVSQD